jgi:hypothetical protein
MQTCPKCQQAHCCEMLTYAKGTADEVCEVVNPLKTHHERCSRCKGQLPAKNERKPITSCWRWWFG